MLCLMHFFPVEAFNIAEKNYPILTILLKFSHLSNSGFLEKKIKTSFSKVQIVFHGYGRKLSL